MKNEGQKVAPGNFLVIIPIFEEVKALFVEIKKKGAKENMPLLLKGSFLMNAEEHI